VRLPKATLPQPPQDPILIRPAPSSPPAKQSSSQKYSDQAPTLVPNCALREMILVSKWHKENGSARLILTKRKFLGTANRILKTMLPTLRPLTISLITEAVKVEAVELLKLPSNHMTVECLTIQVPIPLPAAPLEDSATRPTKSLARSGHPLLVAPVIEITPRLSSWLE